MKNRKNVLILFSIIIFIIVCCGILYYMNRKPSEPETILDDNTQIIKSTNDNKIEKDELEAVDIKIVKESAEAITVTTTLKNNSDTTIENVYMEVYLLNSNGKVVTSFAMDHKEKIAPHSSTTIESYVAGDDADIKSITSAKINRVEKYLYLIYNMDKGGNS